MSMFKKKGFLITLVIFLGSIFLLKLGYSLVEPYVWPVWSSTFNASAVAWLVNHLLPGTTILATQNMLVYPDGQALIIQPGCDGISAIIITLAGVLAFPMPLLRKLAGGVLGVLVVYAGNLARTMMLVYTYQHEQSMFDFFHIYVGQSVIIMLGLAYLYIWTMPRRTTHDS